MRLATKSLLASVVFVWAVAQAANAQPVGNTSIRDGWVTVVPPEFPGAIHNPLKDSYGEGDIFPGGLRRLDDGVNRANAASAVGRVGYSSR